MPAFSNDGERLWHAILRRPHSRRLRLVYADWLDDHGDPRAEFIRLQLGAVPRDPWREAELLRAHELGWLGPMSAHARDWHFSGGLLEWVSVEAPVFLAHADAWVRRPGLLGAHLTDLSGHVRGLADCLAVRRLPYLFLGDNGLTPDDARVLAESPHLKGIRHLYLQNNAIGNDGFAAIVRASTLRGLRVLNLDRTGLQPGLEVPHDSPLGSLRAMSLSHDQIRGEDLLAIVNAPVLASLRTFHARFTGMAAGSLGRLAVSPGFARLRYLSCSGGEVSVADVEALAGSRHARGLCDLRLEYLWQQDGDRGLVALAASPHLSALRRLSLVESIQGAEGYAAFGRPRALPGLRDLRLSLAHPRDQEGGDPIPGIREMMAGRLVRRLRRLVIQRTRIPGDVLSVLAGEGALPLRALAFRVGEGAEDVLAGLVSSGRLDRLRSITFQGTSKPGFTAALCQPGRLPHLRSLEASEYGLDIAALAGASFPLLESLGLDYADDDEEAARSLLAWPGLRKLTRLVLGDTFECLSGLFDGDRMPALEELFCFATTPAVISRLVTWPGLARLRRLTVPGYSLSPEDAARLAGAGWSKRTRVSVMRGAAQTEAVLAPFRARLGPRAIDGHRVRPRETRLS